MNLIKCSETTTKAQKLRNRFDNSWLQGQLGMSYPTLNKRLRTEEWKIHEKAMIEDLFERASKLIAL